MSKSVARKSSPCRRSGKNFARGSAAAFAVGVFLAGPVVVGVAHADSGDPDGSSVSAAAGQSAASAHKSRGSARGERLPGTARGAAGAVRNSVTSAPRPSAAADTREFAPLARVARSASAAVTRRSPAAAEVTVRPAPAAGAPPAARASVAVADDGQSVAPAAQSGVGADVAPAAQSAIESVGGPVAVAAPTGSGSAADALNAAVVGLFDAASRFLYGLPAGPISEFLEGGLLLIRRGLFNQLPFADSAVIAVTDDGGIQGTIAGDVEGDPLSYTVTETPQFGTVQIDAASGVYTYTPGPDYEGMDSFAVSVSDGGFNILNPSGTRSIDVPIPVGLMAGASSPTLTYGQVGDILLPGEGRTFNGAYVGMKFAVYNMTPYKVQVTDYTPASYTSVAGFKDGLVTFNSVDTVDTWGSRAPWYAVLGQKFNKLGYGEVTCRSDGGACAYPDPTWRTDYKESVAVLLDKGCTRYGCYDSIGRDFDFGPGATWFTGNSAVPGKPITGAELKQIYDNLTAFNSNVYDRNSANQNLGGKLTYEFQNVTATIAQLVSAANKAGQSEVAEAINPSGQAANSQNISWSAQVRAQPVPDSPWWKTIGRFATDNLLAPVLKLAGVPEAIATAVKTKLGTAFSAQDVTTPKNFEGVQGGVTQTLNPYSFNRVIVTVTNAINAKGNLVFELPKCAADRCDTWATGADYLGRWRIADIEYVMPNKADYSYVAQFESQPYQPDIAGKPGVKQPNVGFLVASPTQGPNPTYRMGQSESLQLRAFVGSGANAAPGENFDQRGCQGDVGINCTSFTVTDATGKPASGVEVTVNASSVATLRAMQPGTYVVTARYNWQVIRPLSDSGKNMDGTDGWYKDYVEATMVVTVTP